MSAILVVEDDPVLRETIVHNLRRAGHDTSVAADGVTALRVARDEPPDLVMLDLLLPRMSGFEVLRSLRRELAVPVIVLSALDSESDKVRALSTGADDYVTKPFALSEMLARVEAQLRRSRMHQPGAAQDVIDDGVIAIDRSSHEVRKRGEPLRLSPKEFELLAYLVRYAGQVRSRDAILEDVWGYEYGGGTRTVDVHVSSLRRKLEDDPAEPEMLVTVRGYGYKWQPASGRDGEV